MLNGNDTKIEVGFYFLVADVATQWKGSFLSRKKQKNWKWCFCFKSFQCFRELFIICRNCRRFEKKVVTEFTETSGLTNLWLKSRRLVWDRIIGLKKLKLLSKFCLVSILSFWKKLFFNFFNLNVFIFWFTTFYENIKKRKTSFSLYTRGSESPKIQPALNLCFVRLAESCFERNIARRKVSSRGSVLAIFLVAPAPDNLLARAPAKKAGSSSSGSKKNRQKWWMWHILWTIFFHWKSF